MSHHPHFMRGHVTVVWAPSGTQSAAFFGFAIACRPKPSPPFLVGAQQP